MITSQTNFQNCLHHIYLAEYLNTIYNEVLETISQSFYNFILSDHPPHDRSAFLGKSFRKKKEDRRKDLKGGIEFVILE